MNWDDFRYFAAVARTGSVRGAAQQLGVNPSTVTRRVEALETDLGVLLFTRSAKGLHITPEGADVVQQVDQVGEQLREIESNLKGRDQRLEGRIRVAVPDVLAVSFLLADLAPFTEAYPAIDLELMPGYQNPDLRAGEMDVALVATDHPPEDMVGRPLSRVALAAYGSWYVSDGVYLDGIISYGWSDIDADRNIAYSDAGGDVNRTCGKEQRDLGKGVHCNVNGPTDEPRLAGQHGVTVSARQHSPAVEVAAAKCLR